MNSLDTLNGANPHLGLGSVLVFAAVLVFQGCLAEPTSDDNPGPLPDAENTNLVVRMNVQNNTGEPLEQLTFRFTSNLLDTVAESLVIATLAPGSARIVEKSFTFAPLRWWNLQIQALDSAGVVRALGNAGPFASRGAVGTDSLVVTLESFQEVFVEEHPDLQ